MSRIGTLKQSALPVVTGVLGWLWVPLSFWETVRSPVLTALSVMAAAILVRLARGLPFTNADHFEIREIEEVTSAIKQIMAALFLLLTIIVACMLFVVFSSLVSQVIYSLMPSGPISIEKSLSASISLILGYVVSRTIAVARGDVGLVDLQSQFLIRAVQRKSVEKLPVDQMPSPIEYKSNLPYGRLVQ